MLILPDLSLLCRRLVFFMGLPGVLTHVDHGLKYQYVIYHRPFERVQFGY